MKIIHHQTDANQNIIQLEGRLDAVSSFQVKEALALIFETQSQPKIIINLERVPFIDSSGLVALVFRVSAGSREKRANCPVRSPASG
jgi:anti-anti-sigma factor